MKKRIILAILLIVNLLCVLPTEAIDFDPVKDVATKTGEVFYQAGGVLAGFTIAPFIGMVRGAAKGSMIGIDFVAEGIGEKDGSVERAIGALSGGIFGGFGGGVFGLLMGAYDGITLGASEPFSRESLSLSGDYFTDYDLI